MPLGSRVLVGLAVSSHDHAQICEAVFDNFALRALSPEAEVSWASAVGGSGTGLQGQYYPTVDLTGTPVERVDGGIDFNWVRGAPLDGIGPDRFSVVWEGELEAQYSEPYSLHVTSDDRARLWLDGNLLIDEWYEHAEATSSAMVALEAGHRYVIRLEYFENRGRASVRLAWSSPSTPRQVIPRSQLYSEISSSELKAIRDLYAEDSNPSPPAAPNPDLPHTWYNVDVGQVGVPGIVEFSDGVWTVSGAGADIWANGDGFHFVYTPCPEPVTIVVRLLNQEPTDPWAKAGLMVRSGLAANAPHVLLAMTPDHGANLIGRSRPGAGSLIESAPPITQPCWLKLVCSEENVAAFISSDGATWQWVGTEALSMSADRYVGLAVNSHDNSRLGKAEFDRMEFQPVDAVAPVEAVGSGSGLLGSYFDLTSGNLIKRIDSEVAFDWDTASPANGIAPDLFSARWEGLLQPLRGGVHKLHVMSDDGVRLWLDDRLIVDSWKDQGASQSSVQVVLQEGEQHPFMLEFFERSGEALVQLSWSSPSLARQPIPSSQLYPVTKVREITNTVVDSGAVAEDSVGSGPVQEDVSSTIDPEWRQQLAGEITGITTVSAADGATVVDNLGRWATEGTASYAVDRRGYVEYQLRAPSAGIYQLQVEGASHNPRDLDRAFALLLSVDGCDLGRQVIDVGFESSGFLRVLTPWLDEGTHRVRIFWDNARRGRSLEVRAVRLQSLAGADLDADGVPDWMETLLEETSTIAALDEKGVLHTKTSPVCVEGTSRFPELVRVRLGEEVVIGKQGIGVHWFADVPLIKEAPQSVQVAYEDGGRVEACDVIWDPTDLLDEDTVTVRKGDALLFCIGADARAGDVSVTDESRSQRHALHLEAGEKVEYQFTEEGVWEITGAWRASDGSTGNVTKKVEVITFELDEEIAVWRTQARPWIPATLPTTVTLESDPELRVVEDSTSDRLLVSSSSFSKRYVVARLAPSRAILSRTRVDPFDLYSCNETDIEVMNVLPDGTEEISMTVVLSPVLADVVIDIRLVVGGVVFNDGTVTRLLSAASFNPLGEASLTFWRPASAKTSVCHRTRAWQDEVLLGEH